MTHPINSTNLTNLSNSTHPSNEVGQPPVSASASAPTPWRVWVCVLCGFLYDESMGMPEAGIQPGTVWADVPEDWICPDCSVPKSDFELVEI